MKAIIIFQKNAVLGKVKTRLAKTVGNEKALEIYEFLTQKTHSILKEIDVTKFLYFSDEAEVVQMKNYKVCVQKGNDLGERMFNAFNEVMDQGYSEVIIVGTDCYELTSKIIQEGFQSLKQNQYTLGPALDGGYYLLGTNQKDPSVFLNKSWSHSEVLNEAMKNIQTLNKSYHLLPELSDVDIWDDWENLKLKFTITI